MASRLLKEFELLLSDYQFFRVHNSHLININEVQRYIRSEGLIEMNDGNTVAISLNRKEEFINRMRSTK